MKIIRFFPYYLSLSYVRTLLIAGTDNVMTRVSTDNMMTQRPYPLPLASRTLEPESRMQLIKEYKMKSTIIGINKHKNKNTYISNM